MTHKLDKLDITALRKADTISFHTVNDDLLTTRSFIRASVKVKANAGDPFGDSVERSREIECNAILRNYEGTVPLYPAKPSYKAFEFISSAQFCDEWNTVASMLKPDDVITFLWSKGGATCDTHRNASLVGDTFTLRIERGDRRMSFLMSVYVGQNNTARMIKAA